MITMTLFFIELKRVLRSITFWMMAVLLVVVGISQGVFPPGEGDTIKPPQPGLESYGSKAGSDPDKIMPEALDSLYLDFRANSYVAYPMGFYKNVHLNERERERMAWVLSELTGVSEAELLAAGEIEEQGRGVTIQTEDLERNEDGSFVVQSDGNPERPKVLENVTLAEGMSYEAFLALMQQADRIIGGGSSYSGDYLLGSFGREPLTYEEALADYELMLEKDRYTGAHARLFCDYMGIFLAVLPVFPAVALMLADKRDIRPALYSRSVAAWKLLLCRWMALVTATLLPLLLMGGLLTGFHCMQYSGTGVALDLLAYFKYILGWLLPTILVSSGMGIFLTALTGTPAAIALQGIWWFMDTMGNVGALTGGYRISLAPRHNALGRTQVFLDGFGVLVQNRVGYTLLALALFGLAVWVLGQKRRGRLEGARIAQRLLDLGPNRWRKH